MLHAAAAQGRKIKVAFLRRTALWQSPLCESVHCKQVFCCAKFLCTVFCRSCTVSAAAPVFDPGLTLDPSLSKKIFFLQLNQQKFCLSLQTFVGQDNWSAKNCLSRGKTSVFPRLCTEARSTKGNSSAQVQCTVQRVQPDRGHHCGRSNKRYDPRS